MVSKSAKGLLIGLTLLLGGLYFARGASTTGIVIISVVTTIAIVAAVNKFIRGRSTEMFVSSFLLGVPETYVFLIQPEIPLLPALPGNLKLFFGIAIVTRIVILLLEIIDTPLKKPVRGFLDG